MFSPPVRHVHESIVRNHSITTNLLEIPPINLIISSYNNTYPMYKSTERVTHYMHGKGYLVRPTLPSLLQHSSQLHAEVKPSPKYHHLVKTLRDRLATVSPARQTEPLSLRCCLQRRSAASQVVLRITRVAQQDVSLSFAVVRLPAHLPNSSTIY